MSDSRCALVSGEASIRTQPSACSRASSRLTEDFSSRSAFPTTPGAYKTTFSGGANDVFVAKLNATGSALVYSTYVGGSTFDAFDFGHAIAVDAGGRAVVVGETLSLELSRHELDDNTLTVNFDNGNPIPLGGLTFVGHGDGINDNDTLILEGGGSLASVTHQFVNANNGSIIVESTIGNGRTITYTGLEPIFDNLDAIDRVFNFAATSDQITLEDDFNGIANVSRISSASTSIA